MALERLGLKSILSKGAEMAKRLATEEDGMLILVRKVQQGIWIEGNIWVKVLSVERDRVKLGITAPGDVKVMRQELIKLDVEGQVLSDAPAKPEKHTGQKKPLR